MACLCLAFVLLCAALGLGEADDYPAIDKGFTSDQWMKLFNEKYFVRVEFFRPPPYVGVTQGAPYCPNVFDGGPSDLSDQKLQILPGGLTMWKTQVSFKRLKVAVVRYVESWNGFGSTTCLAGETAADAGPWLANRWDLLDPPQVFDVIERVKMRGQYLKCNIPGQNAWVKPAECSTLPPKAQKTRFGKYYGYDFVTQCRALLQAFLAKVPESLRASYANMLLQSTTDRWLDWSFLGEYPGARIDARRSSTLPWSDYVVHRSLSFVEYWSRFGRDGFWQSMPYTDPGTSRRIAEVGDFFLSCEPTQLVACVENQEVHVKMSVWVGQKTSGGDEDYDKPPAAVWPYDAYTAWSRQGPWKWRDVTPSDARAYDAFGSCLHCPLSQQTCVTNKCPSGTYASDYLHLNDVGTIVASSPAITCVPCAAGTWHTSARAGVTFWDIPPEDECQPFDGTCIGTYGSNANVMNHIMDRSLFPIRSCFPCRYAPNLVHNGDSQQYVVYTDEFYCPGGSSGPVKCAAGEVANSEYTSCGCKEGQFKDPSNVKVDLATNARVPQCSPCPIGHRCDGKLKYMCGDHEYQDQAGQSECKKCSEDGETALIDVCRDNTYMRKCIGASVGWHTLSPPVCVPCNACRRAGMNSGGLEECYLGGN